LCTHEICRKRASWGYSRRDPQRCSDDAVEGMKSVRSLCVECDATQYASYGLPEGKRTHCASCKTDDMVLKCRNSKCVVCGEAEATCALKGDRPTHCGECKTDDMVNVRSKKCEVCGEVTASCGLHKGKPTHCGSCKTSDMVDVVGKMCEVCGEVRASCALKGDRPTHCGSCKTGDMVDVVNKKCEVCGEVTANCALKGDRPTHCASCKTDDMVNVKSKKCEVCGEVTASCGLDGKRTHCGSCKTDEMVGVMSKRCKGLLESVTNGHGTLPCGSVGNRRYRGYCTVCFKANFPTDPLTLQMHFKVWEPAVVSWINANFEGWRHNCRVPSDCGRPAAPRNLDHWKIFGNTLFCVETDEHQHNGYDAADERLRYSQFEEAFSGKQIWIRFNPDSFRDQNGKRRTPELAGRLRTLLEEMKKQIQRIECDEHCQTDRVEIIYLYYDGYVV